MKSFLEEYGFAILAAIVVIVLILMATPVGQAIRTALEGLVGKFTSTTNNAFDSINLHV